MPSASPLQSSFSNIVLPSNMLALEEHDDALASISRSCADTVSGSFSVDNSSAHTVSSSSTAVSTYSRNDLNRIGYIGSGTYCKVDMVTPSDSSEMFALKSIDPRRVQGPTDFHVATGELANEAKILSGLDHENIIKLRGVCEERFSDSYTSGCGGYFLVLDILSETLDDRLSRWRKASKPGRRSSGMRRTRNSITNLFKKRSSSTSVGSSVCDVQDLHNRIQDTAMGIAKGMRYLHSNNIVLRDLKPANIGYENIYDGDVDETLVESTVRLFDFGMAEKVEKCDPEEVCGSPRYMAPEVMAQEGYSLACDVYSFGVILYEMCSLMRPFEETFKQRKQSRRQRSKGIAIGEFYRAVVRDQIKPSDNLENEVACPKLRRLIEECWSYDPAQRPSFDEILSRLFKIFNPRFFPTGDDSDCLRSSRDVTTRSVSIEFECAFDLPCSDSSTEIHSYP